MANFESVKMTNPYGIEDTVLKLSIDSEQNSYRLSNLITEPDSYVFVIWHKTNTPCTISINVFGEIITSESNSQWTKVVKVKKVSDVSNKNIDITPPINSTTFFTKHTYQEVRLILLGLLHQRMMRKKLSV